MGEVKRASKQVRFSRSKHLYSFNIEYITMLISNCAAVGKHVSTAEFRFIRGIASRDWIADAISMAS
jgi:hypothetical protein